MSNSHTLAVAPSASNQTAPRIAPRGFTAEQWSVFNRDGILVLPDLLNPGEIDAYRDAALTCTARQSFHRSGHTQKIQDLIRYHPLFSSLIDHERHVGYAYDLYGDQLRLGQMDLFLRPPRSVVNNWHVDGPRALPYRAFSPVLPLKLRIGYWLTDVSEADMGNLVYLPGSHRGDYALEHTGICDLKDQKTLCCRAGTITIHHASLWHRVCGNASEATRLTIFLSYGPSWVTGYYSYPDDDWLASFSREQRIILRAYSDKEDLTRPPAEDLPLFQDLDSPAVGSEEEPHKVRRLTRYERNLRHAQDESG
ncbi:phytanoyl-CoA dioxygenase family protein [Bradyrhizobium japonicum]|uniref:phytanoyl-CoA dioxygenase family protein n=1 Tax=Bradyrhizobium japonicum TaxID=375 RepID=UPI00200E98A8|nr:phytanoyl-CoA dioxygenase family protein [Bradyrhizobium japonicum]UQE03637.1 phytanoyl-CoA dioxygenase family protein [Bradyrhizobium japonicum]